MEYTGFNYPINISSQAIIGDKAIIGKGSKIWHFCNILAGAKIGENCSLGMGCFIGNNVIIGDNCRLQSYVVVGEGVTIEDGVFISTYTCFMNISNPRAEVNRRGEYEKTLVKRGATIGSGVMITPGITFGEYCMVGAGAIVTHDVPAHALVYGNPARQHGWVCQCGEKLNFKEDHAYCERCKRSYYISKDGKSIAGMDE